MPFRGNPAKWRFSFWFPFGTSQKRVLCAKKDKPRLIRRGGIWRATCEAPQPRPAEAHRSLHMSTRTCRMTGAMRLARQTNLIQAKTITHERPHQANTSGFHRNQCNSSTSRLNRCNFPEPNQQSWQERGLGLDALLRGARQFLVGMGNLMRMWGSRTR